ncbi:hypothetical protein PTSG_05532 [Salpingoeca rosetta]|uniref:Uncharacterized protein n=1 Tax=Salpingoeca rosetta (strain ATCC 50818 / BSB-021) TaxID=946362 RepID=F2UBH2_SALR5|nr:uncharacterized protein PTSG_05532 [Salpingoeca rosetta]EGD73838.1 hypothetical protein PTSG_05532 [Salpingoeca rosetta]|eukprot:XP_004993401.1 hypothetical protein PTSG_05532 [Salpingoeca rosetta]
MTMMAKEVVDVVDTSSVALAGSGDAGDGKRGARGGWWVAGGALGRLSTLVLPEGYPASVSSDYASYQIWDTAQAFSSSVMGTISTYAVLKGVGVGDAQATVAAATYTNLLRDATGMLAGIWFAWYSSTDMDRNAKQWRLVADVVNDMAMLVELVSPLIPAAFLPLMCMASFLRAIVGVAGGATRAALVRHQARLNNMADVSAKDGSQETLVNLAALVVSLAITPLAAESRVMAWAMFLPLVFMHLYCNYRAVRALEMPAFNAHRLHHACAVFMRTNRVPSVCAANQAEPLFPRAPAIEGHAKVCLGSSWSHIKDGVGAGVQADVVRALETWRVAAVFTDGTVHVLLSKHCRHEDIVRAYAAALFWIQALMLRRSRS